MQIIDYDILSRRNDNDFLHKGRLVSIILSETKVSNFTQACLNSIGPFY